MLARLQRPISIIDQRVILTPLGPCEIIEIDDLMELPDGWKPARAQFG